MLVAIVIFDRRVSQVERGTWLCRTNSLEFIKNHVHPKERIHKLALNASSLILNLILIKKWNILFSFFFSLCVCGVGNRWVHRVLNLLPLFFVKKCVESFTIYEALRQLFTLSLVLSYEDCLRKKKINMKFMTFFSFFNGRKTVTHSF